MCERVAAINWDVASAYPVGKNRTLDGISVMNYPSALFLFNDLRIKGWAKTLSLFCFPGKDNVSPLFALLKPEIRTTCSTAILRKKLCRLKCNIIVFLPAIDAMATERAIV